MLGLYAASHANSKVSLASLGSLALSAACFVGETYCACLEVSGYIMGNVVTPLHYVMGSAARPLGFQHTVKHHQSSWEESKHMRLCEAVALPLHGVGTTLQGSLCLSSELLTLTFPRHHSPQSQLSTLQVHFYIFLYLDLS